MVTDCDTSYTFSNGFNLIKKDQKISVELEGSSYDSSTLMTQDNGEQTLHRAGISISISRIPSELRQTSGSLPLRVYSSVWQIPGKPMSGVAATPH